MRNWIRDCDETHERCCRDLTPSECETAIEAMPFLPTRMIDVGDGLNDKHPRLVITSEMQNKASKNAARTYMALSYCWGPVDGTSKLLKTTHSTMRSRTEKIELDSMPQTFQDAVALARRLSIRYLWIDSLCIIQDDPRDWQIESSKMADIFSKAYLTLIAASGSGCNDGFLDQGSPDLFCTVPLKLDTAEGRFSLRFRRRWGTSDKMADIIGSKWITRGWTFQEERLARRVLMFGENKFFFDCRTLERCQDTDKHWFRPDWVTSVIEGPTEDYRINSENTELGRHWDHWQTLCSHYSYRELTFPGDKLPAISGMASKIAKKVQSEYLAGVWRINLIHDLFWQTVAEATKPEEYRAPSWSWASLNGQINWPLWREFSTCSGCKTYCTVLDVQTTRAGLDPYGAVQDGFLKIRVAIQEMTVIRVDGDESLNPWRLHYQGVEIGNASLDVKSSALQVQGRENMYHALLVAECQSSGPDVSKSPIRGLLLEKNGREREGHNEFERVGTFSLFPGVIPGHDGGLCFGASDAEQVIMIV